MRKSYVLICIFLIFIVLVTVTLGTISLGNIPIIRYDDIFTIQSNKEIYFNVYGYTLDNPNIIVNPYGNSPLTAIVMFETDKYAQVEVTIKSKDGNSDINYKFDKDKYHMIPIYGLYADYDNTVIIKSEGKEKIINIKTNKLPEDFIYFDESSYDNFMFYNVNYPYAIDINGDVRWYLNSNYYGNITLLDNSSFIIGSDLYNEEGNTISLYKMNLLGKIYNEYLLDGDYYGYNTLYHDNILVLSDSVMLLDIQTGDVISKFIENDDYEYLGLDYDSIIISKEDKFYKIDDDMITETEHSIVNSKGSFYNNTNNYKIINPERYGSLGETLVSDKNITLINYEKIKKLEDISIEVGINRIKVTNNTESDIYLVFDKLFDKRVYVVRDIKYINTFGLNGKYTIYYMSNNKLYKTDYYIEV